MLAQFGGRILENRQGERAAGRLNTAALPEGVLLTIAPAIAALILPPSTETTLRRQPDTCALASTVITFEAVTVPTADVSR